MLNASTKTKLKEENMNVLVAVHLPWLLRFDFWILKAWMELRVNRNIDPNLWFMEEMVLQ